MLVLAEVSMYATLRRHPELQLLAHQLIQNTQAATLIWGPGGAPVVLLRRRQPLLEAVQGCAFGWSVRALRASTGAGPRGGGGFAHPCEPGGVSAMLLERVTPPGRGDGVCAPDLPRPTPPHTPTHTKKHTKTLTKDTAITAPTPIRHSQHRWLPAAGGRGLRT